MNRNFTLQLLPIIIVFTGCTRKAYFLSPLSSNSNTYYAKPLLADSARTAIYVTAVYTEGDMNAGSYSTHRTEDDGRETYTSNSISDKLQSFQLSFHRSHTSKHFQAYYGAGISTGTYTISRYDSLQSDKLVNVALINSQAGRKYFGGGSLAGGINLVIPFKKGYEWRAVGIEGNIGKEWGDYYKFRKNLPDSSANAVTRNNTYGSIGITSEVVFKKGKNNFGFKIGYGTSLFRTIELGKSDVRTTYVTPFYFTGTMQYSRPKFTIFIQVNEASHAESAQFGVSYKLSRVHHSSNKR
jgi:hypothetical protein